MLFVGHNLWSYSKRAMLKPIAVSSVFSVIAHIGMGGALILLHKHDPVVLQIAPVQKARVNVQLVQAPAPAPPRPEEPKKRIVTTAAPSDVQTPKKTPVKQAPSLKAVAQHKPKSTPAKPAPKVIANHISSQAVISEVEDTPAQGASSKYRRVDKPQLVGRQVQPAYPYRARKLRHQGTVILDVKLDEKGKVVTMEVEKASGYRSLDKAALSAVGRWRFQPLVENGRGIRSRVRIPVRFHLE